MIDLVAPEQFQAGGITRALREADVPEICDINLRRLKWIEPAGLVAVAAVAEQARLDNRRVQVLAPAGLSEANYLSRMGLPGVFEDMGVVSDLPSVQRHGSRGENMLLTLRRFEGEAGADALATLLFDLVEPKDGELAGPLHEVAAEMAGNAAEHSTRGHGYLAAQTTYNGQFVQFAVADSGIGIWQTLGDYGLANEQEALDRVLAPKGLSSRPSGGGRGLPLTRRLVTERGGTFRVTSRATTATVQSSDRITYASHQPMPGVLVSGALRCTPKSERARRL